MLRMWYSLMSNGSDNFSSVCISAYPRVFTLSQNPYFVWTWLCMYVNHRSNLDSSDWAMEQLSHIVSHWPKPSWNHT